MKYRHTLAALMAEPWAMQPEKLAAIAELIAHKALDIPHAARFTPAEDRKIAGMQGNVLVLPMRGVISQRMNMMSEFSGGTSIEKLSQQFAAAVDDPAIKAIVFDVDSPGGSVAGVPEFAAQIRAARVSKRIVAQVNSVAASAAYWLATAAEEVVVTPSGQTGSVGVYTMHQDVSAAMETAGVKTTFVHAGEHKVEGNPYEPLSEEAKATLQKSVDEFYGMFVGDLALNRGISVKDVNEGFGQGHMFGAKESVQRGMADRVGSLPDTLLRLGINSYTGSSKTKAGDADVLRRRVALANAKLL